MTEKLRRAFCLALPLGIVNAYRMIPADTRGALPYFGAKPSSSGHAARWIRAGGGWTAFFTAAIQDECRLALGEKRWGG
jgi:hypothetical protein